MPAGSMAQLFWLDKERAMENRDQEKQEQSAGNQKDKKRTTSAAQLDSIMGSATEAVRSNKHQGDWGNTGTNISYEGAKAPGSGGSVGTGEASGQDAVGARISSDDAYDYAAGRKDNEGEDLMKPEQNEDGLDRETLGTP